MQHVRQIERKTASWTLTQADSGKVFLIGVADCVATLPSLAALSGDDAFYCTFIVDTLSTTTGFSISPNALDAINDGTANKDLINTAATDALGDAVTIYGNDSADADNWWAVVSAGTWAAES
ncbi:MAG: hypothetical protein KJO44_06215 [Gemmatimonadetes bacterium]|nr:hypothetical protein [Gemmatimonadota bacterium]